MRTSFFKFIIPFILVLSFSVTAAASQSRTHDGFFLRMGLGGGFANSSSDSPYGDVNVKGGAVDLELSIGGNIVENFALHADLFGLFIPGPTLEMDGYETDTGAEDVSFSINAFGAGFTYYFMPVNLYVSLSAGLAVLQMQVENMTSETDPGFGTRFMIGKEWWVSDEWGLGAAGNFIFSVVKDSDDSTWVSMGGGLLFSVTFN